MLRARRLTLSLTSAAPRSPYAELGWVEHNRTMYFWVFIK